MPNHLITSSPHNLIPKVIHYCWFGKGQMPELVERYDAFAGYEGSKRNPVMMGVIAAKAHHPWIQGMMKRYMTRNFLREN